MGGRDFHMLFFPFLWASVAVHWVKTGFHMLLEASIGAKRRPLLQDLTPNPFPERKGAREINNVLLFPLPMREGGQGVRFDWEGGQGVTFAGFLKVLLQYD